MKTAITQLLRKKKIKDMATIGICLAPSLVLILVFTYFAFIFCVYLSFYRWDLLAPRKFIGLSNYITAFTTSDFTNSLRITFLYALFAIPTCVIMGLIAGLFLDWILFAKSFFRLMLFLPVIVSTVVASTVWRQVLDPANGGLNKLLFSLGIKASHWTNWLADPFGGAFVSILLVNIWKRLGYNGVLFLGGLKNISNEFYEAAIIDGANSWQRFIRITLPLLSPTTFMVTMLQLFSAFRVVDSVMLLTGGGPANSTMVMVLYIYNNAFQWLKMGYASAVSIVLFVIVLCFTVLQMIFEKKIVHYQ
jgi:ABC-type sugar transport system permease subunit